MSARTALYIAVILLFLLAIAVIAVAALVRRPRSDWQVAVMGQTKDVRQTGIRNVRGQPVKPRRVSLDEMWATNSVAHSAYVGAPRIPDKTAVRQALAPPPSELTSQYHGVFLVGGDAMTATTPPRPAPPPPPREDVAFAPDADEWASAIEDVPLVTGTDLVVVPQEPQSAVFKDPFYDEAVRSGQISMFNAALPRPLFSDEEALALEDSGDDVGEPASASELARRLVVTAQTVAANLAMWATGLKASADSWIAERREARTSSREERDVDARDDDSEAETSSVDSQDDAMSSRDDGERDQVEEHAPAAVGEDSDRSGDVPDFYRAVGLGTPAPPPNAPAHVRWLHVTTDVLAGAAAAEGHATDVGPHADTVPVPHRPAPPPPPPADEPSDGVLDIDDVRDDNDAPKPDADVSYETDDEGDKD